MGQREPSAREDRIDIAYLGEPEDTPPEHAEPSHNSFGSARPWWLPGCAAPRVATYSSVDDSIEAAFGGQ